MLICIDCPAGFQRDGADISRPENGGDNTKCIKKCPPKTYVSEDGLECLNDGDKCTIWEALNDKGKCSRCEQKPSPAVVY